MIEYPQSDVQGLASDCGRPIGRQEYSSRSQLLEFHVPLEGGVSLVVLQHFRETTDSPGRQGIHRSGADRIDPNLLRTQIIRQITHGGFQCRLGHAHDIIMRNHPLGAEVAHGQNAATLGHQGQGRAADRNQRIGADIQGSAEGFPIGIDELTL